MKHFEIKKEALIWIIMLLPACYLYHVWPTLPETVPIHFGLDGHPDGWGHKMSLVYTTLGMQAGMYLLFTVIPYIDPKGKIDAMGKKYFLLKLCLMLFFSMLCFFIIQSAIDKSIGNTNAVYLLIGGLFVFLGNFMQTFKPNYFIGIRTPWTLENEMIWRKTHQLGGKLFFAAGLLTMILPYILGKDFSKVFLAIILTASAIPIAYSYFLFTQGKKQKREPGN